MSPECVEKYLIFTLNKGDYCITPKLHTHSYAVKSHTLMTLCIMLIFKMKKNDCSHHKVPVELVFVEVVCQRGEFDSLAQRNKHWLHVDSGIKS